MSVSDVAEIVANILNELIDTVLKTICVESVMLAKDNNVDTNCQALMVYNGIGKKNRPAFKGKIFNPVLGPQPILRLMVNLPTLRVFDKVLNLKSYKSGCNLRALTCAASLSDDIFDEPTMLTDNLLATLLPKGDDGMIAMEYNLVADYTDDKTLPCFFTKSKRLSLYVSDLFSYMDIGQVSIVSELALMVCQLSSGNDFIKAFHTIIIDYYEKEYGRHFTPKPITTSAKFSQCFWESLSFLSKLNRSSVFGVVMQNRLLEKFCKLYILQHHICNNCGKKLKIGERIQCCGLYAHARKILEHEHLKLCALRNEFVRLRFQFKTEKKMEILGVEYYEYHSIIRKLINKLNNSKPDFVGLGLLDNHKLFFYNEYTLQMKRLYHFLRELDETMKNHILLGPPKERINFANITIDCPPYYKFLGPNACAYKNYKKPLLATDSVVYNVNEATNAVNYNLEDAINPDVLNCWTTNLESFIKLDIDLKAVYYETQQAFLNKSKQNQYHTNEDVNNKILTDYENVYSNKDNDDLILLHFDESFEF